MHHIHIDSTCGSWLLLMFTKAQSRPCLKYSNAPISLLVKGKKGNFRQSVAKI